MLKIGRWGVDELVPKAGAVLVTGESGEVDGIALDQTRAFWVIRDIAQRFGHAKCGEGVTADLEPR